MKDHFIRDYVQKGVIDIQLIDIYHQLADVFIKPLAIERIDFIKKNLNMVFIEEYCLLLDKISNYEVNQK